jgi:hypothetical protein
MEPSVKQLAEQALLLTAEARTELVEAILEGSEPSGDFIAGQMETVLARMKNVSDGNSNLISAEEAHRKVREALAAAS